MGSGTWFMSWAMSPEDGAVSLINCCAQVRVRYITFTRIIYLSVLFHISLVISLFPYDYPTYHFVLIYCLQLLSSRAPSNPPPPPHLLFQSHLKSGDCLEPSNMGNMSGPPGPFYPPLTPTNTLSSNTHTHPSLSYYYVSPTWNLVIVWSPVTWGTWVVLPAPFTLTASRWARTLNQGRWIERDFPNVIRTEVIHPNPVLRTTTTPLPLPPPFLLILILPSSCIVSCLLLFVDCSLLSRTMLWEESEKAVGGKWQL